MFHDIIQCTINIHTNCLNNQQITRKINYHNNPYITATHRDTFENVNTCLKTLEHLKQSNQNRLLQHSHTYTKQHISEFFLKTKA